MNDQSLEFSITVSAAFWNKKPQFSIWLDDKVVTQSEAGAEASIIKFVRSLDDGEHSLKIRLENKTPSDTVIENGAIVKDMLLNVDDITIDNVSLGNLMWESEYLLDSPQSYNGKEITRLDRCINLGWNGTYVMKFSSPFYIWLLEPL